MDSLEAYFASVKERGYERVDYLYANIIAKKYVREGLEQQRY